MRFLGKSWLTAWLALAAACGGKGAGEGPKKPGDDDAGPIVTSDAAAAPAQSAESTQPAKSAKAARTAKAARSTQSAGTTFEAAMTTESAYVGRRQRFGEAVARIAAAQGLSIDAEMARRAEPCGGWSGPGCSNLTAGIEVTKVAVMLAVQTWKVERADVVFALVEAVSNHSVWHDAYGYVYRAAEGAADRGPGYTYIRPCLGLLSTCDPSDPLAGHVEGILFQLGRSLGKITAPECGLTCTL